MKKIILALSVALIAGQGAMAQKEKEVKYDKLYYKDLKKETEKITITVDNAVSTEGETKFKLKITNLTSEYLIFKPEECKFVINGKEMKPKEKWLVIKPNESDFRVINLKGDKYNSVKTYSFVLDGVYEVIPDQTPGVAADFKLPAAANEFKTGSYKCTMSSLTKETDKTEVKFKCSYTGTRVGFVDPSKAAVKMPDGSEHANAAKGGLLAKSGPILLMKGEEDSFTCKWDRMEGGKKMDMQKVDMWIVWKETFREASLQKIQPETLKMEFDEVASNSKK